MKAWLTCAWCRTGYNSGEKNCKQCGHEVGKSRMDCRCARCLHDYYPKQSQEPKKDQ